MASALVAGLGSSVMVHSSSNVKEPVRQGMWGIFEVFADTMVVCTLTAFAVLSSVLMIFIGCTMNLGLAWDLSDSFNGLMAIPNLIGVIALSPVVMKITKNYVARIIKKEDVKPMLSVFPEIQEEQEKTM